ncbi:ANTAR domain-containing protein [Streptomyces sp. NPDC006997]|uniref:ANTAR domain-containing protein n=1 Tax=Streptomyces sp. NPDC006997 TaxID=3155356 RepID=UPI0033C080CA
MSDFPADGAEPRDPGAGPRAPSGFELAEALALAARQLHDASTAQGTLRTAVRLAVRLLPGAEHAAVTVVDRGDGHRTVAWSDDLVRTVQGTSLPYWTALWHTPVVRLPDDEATGTGARAGTAIPAGADDPDTGILLPGPGLASALALRLRADRRRLTVLTAYARLPRVFDDTAAQVGRLFTAHVSLALESATEREQLTEAMRTRDLIGQATGVLMERLDIDAAEAFGSLVRASQRENVKLRDLARRLVDESRRTV